jgi:LDH2 family malate/lactate/ureidoglycolate dehydrogenase
MPLRANVPPTVFVRVPAAVLREYAYAILRHIEMPEDQAELLARLLVDSDLRGVHSHGTWQLPRYINEIKSGGINLRPAIRVLSDSATVTVIDGDGGLGYTPAWLATQAAIRKAQALGLGAATTRHHGHFGAAGHYSRACAAAGCVGIAASAVRYTPAPGSSIWWATSAPPISFAIPAGDQPPIVPDMGVFITGLTPEMLEKGFALMPDAFIKLLGFGAVAHALGAHLAGIYDYPPAERPQYGYATQGTFVLALNIAHFLPPAEFRRQMERYVAACRAMQPFPGGKQAELPGGYEWQREKEYARDGVPVSPQQREALAQAAAAAGFMTLDAWMAQTKAP